MARQRADALHDDRARQPRSIPGAAGDHDDDRGSMSAPQTQPLQQLPDAYTLELTPQELAFLRLLVTNATVQPAELKKLCGEVQAKIEAHIGPLPPSV